MFEFEPSSISVSWRGCHRTAGSGMENLAVRSTMLDMTMYTDSGYRQELHESLRQSLRSLAAHGGGNLPLCVVAHGFGSVLAIDFFSQLQREFASTNADVGGATTPLERGQTLAFVCTLGSPLPLLAVAVGGESATGEPTSFAAPLQVPASPVKERWPHLRGGWTNFYHREDCLGYPLQAAQSTVSKDVECRRRLKGDQPIQSEYFSDIVDCVNSLAQSISWIWQDTNRKHND